MKIARHDNSLTEEEKIEFRNSQVWKDFRMSKFTEQDGKDFITCEPLQTDFNCHHMCMLSNQYTNLLPERFVALNKETHKKIHELFNSGRDVKNERAMYVINKMRKLNDDIEVNLYRNAYEYTLINPSDKKTNTNLASQLSIPVNKYGMLQWHKFYIPKYVPQDTKEWVKYMVKQNGMENVLLCMELRHLNLYSSYRNFRNNPGAHEDVKQQCLQELNTITYLLKLYKNYCNK